MKHHRRRHHRHRSYRSNPVGSSIKSLFSRENLVTAGGVVGASFVTNWVLGNYGASLPLAQTTYGRLAWQVGIPVLGAMVARRMSRPLAEGMIYGGLANAMGLLVTGALTSATPSAVASTGEWLNRSTPSLRGLGAVGAALAPVLPLSTRAPQTVAGAFKTSAW